MALIAVILHCLKKWTKKWTKKPAWRDVKGLGLKFDSAKIVALILHQKTFLYFFFKKAVDLTKITVGFTKIAR